MEDIPEEIQNKEQAVQLQVADAVLLFSDGAFEIENARDEMLGVDGFLQILKNLDYPKFELNMDVFEKELLKFSNDIRLQDDITIIEIRFSGQSASG